VPSGAGFLPSITESIRCIDVRAVTYCLRGSFSFVVRETPHQSSQTSSRSYPPNSARSSRVTAPRSQNGCSACRGSERCAQGMAATCSRLAGGAQTGVRSVSTER
jgi:hypothetical protein